MASRYSLGTLLAIVIPISAVLLLSLLLLLIFCCFFIKQKSHIRQLNKQVSFNAQNERYNLRKKNPSDVDPSGRAKLKTPWYQKLMFCGCCGADVSHADTSPSAQEKGLQSNQVNSRANDVSRHNSHKHSSGAPQKHEGRHEMKFLSGQQDDPARSSKKVSGSTTPQTSHYKGDPRATATSTTAQDRSLSGSVQPSRYSHSAAPAKVVDTRDSKCRSKPSHESSGAEGLEYGTPKEYTTKSGKRDPSNESPQDILPPAPLNLNSQGIILTDEDTQHSTDEPKYFEKYQAEALERDQKTRDPTILHEREVTPREVLNRDQMGRDVISRQDSMRNSSVYPSSSIKSPLTRDEDRFTLEQQSRTQGDYHIDSQDSGNETPTLSLDDSKRNSTQYKWLDPPINLARVHRGENKMSMIASFVEPLTPISPVDHQGLDRMDQYSTPEDKGTPAPNHTTTANNNPHPVPGAIDQPAAAQHSMNTSHPLHSQASSQNAKGYDYDDYAQGSHGHGNVAAATTVTGTTTAAAATVASTHSNHQYRSSQQPQGNYQSSGQAQVKRTSNVPASRGSIHDKSSSSNHYAGIPVTSSSQSHPGPQPIKAHPDHGPSSMSTSKYSNKYPRNQGSLMNLSVDGTSQSGDNSEYAHSPNIVDHSPHWKPSPIATSSTKNNSYSLSHSSPSNSGDNYFPIPRQSKARDERKSANSSRDLRDENELPVPQVPHAAESTSRKSRHDRSVNRSKDYSRDEPTSSYGTEWHRNRPDTESSVESEYTHGTYATAPSRAPSRAPYDTSREKEPMIPVHSGDHGLETPWRSRRSQSTSSRASSLLFSVSEKGHISSSSHRKKGSISSSTRTKHKDPSKLNKPLPKTPGGRNDGHDFADDATVDTNETNSPMASQSGPVPASASLSSASKAPSVAQPVKTEDGVVANMGGMLFHAVFPYHPALEDELALTPREVVKVYQVFDDGWCFARKENPTNGPAHGICPKVCLANISE